MQYILIVLIILVIFDIYSRIKIHNRIIKHLIVTLNYYERILLAKKVISIEDVSKTRQMVKEHIIKEGGDDKEYKKTVHLIANYDEFIIQAIEQLWQEDGLKNKKLHDLKVKLIAEAIYNKEYDKIPGIIKE